MIIEITSRINFENLQNKYTCIKDLKTLQFDNLCDKIFYKRTLAKFSFYFNSPFVKSNNYSNPSFASKEIFCFSWNQNSILSH